MTAAVKALNLKRFLKERGMGTLVKAPDLEAPYIPDPTGTRPTPYAHVQHNLLYVLAAIPLSSGGDEVLMIQEARKNCLGTWYVPSTKLEPKEKMTDYLKKQTTLMTGMECEPVSLVSVESQGGRWHRLSFLMKVSGGKLKSRADEHSQQAQWVPVRSVLDGKTGFRLRSDDALVLVSRALEMWASLQSQSLCAVVPTDFPHGCLNTRLVLVRQKADKVAVVVTRTGYQLPVIRFPPRSAGMAVIGDFFKKAFGEESVKYRYCGVLAIEHSPSMEAFRRTDGLCTTMVIKIDSSSEYILDFEKDNDYKWLVVEDEEVSRELMSIVDGRTALPSFKLIASTKESMTAN